MAGENFSFVLLPLRLGYRLLWRDLDKCSFGRRQALGLSALRKELVLIFTTEWRCKALRLVFTH